MGNILLIHIFLNLLNFAHIYFAVFLSRTHLSDFSALDFRLLSARALYLFHTVSPFLVLIDIFSRIINQRLNFLCKSVQSLIINFPEAPIEASSTAAFDGYDLNKYRQFLAGKQARGEQLLPTDPAAYFNVQVRVRSFIDMM